MTSSTLTCVALSTSMTVIALMIKSLFPESSSMMFLNLFIWILVDDNSFRRFFTSYSKCKIEKVTTSVIPVRSNSQFFAVKNGFIMLAYRMTDVRAIVYHISNLFGSVISPQTAHEHGGRYHGSILGLSVIFWWRVAQHHQIFLLSGCMCVGDVQSGRWKGVSETLQAGRLGVGKVCHAKREESVNSRCVIPSVPPESGAYQVREEGERREEMKVEVTRVRWQGDGY